MGIDLAWKVPPRPRGTGACVLAEDGTVELLDTVSTDREVLDLLPEGDAWVGIDASLRLPAGKGPRGCEAALRRRGIRVLPTDRAFYLRRYGGCRGEVLAAELEGRGYRYFGDGPRAPFEVYPHAALSILGGGRVPRYKKGPREERKGEAERALDLLRRWLPGLRAGPELLPGKGLDDRLDALVGAALLYAHRLYAGGATEVVGDEDDGYILLPRSERGHDR